MGSMCLTDVKHDVFDDKYVFYYFSTDLNRLAHNLYTILTDLSRLQQSFAAILLLTITG